MFGLVQVHNSEEFMGSERSRSPEVTTIFTDPEQKQASVISVNKTMVLRDTMHRVPRKPSVCAPED